MGALYLKTWISLCSRSPATSSRSILVDSFNNSSVISLGSVQEYGPWRSAFLVLGLYTGNSQAVVALLISFSSVLADTATVMICSGSLFAVIATFAAIWLIVRLARPGTRTTLVIALSKGLPARAATAPFSIFNSMLLSSCGVERFSECT